MSTPTMDDAAKVLADPTAYADDARLHAALTHLRANNPVAWVDNPPYRPFWAITKHADIMAIERANDLFLSEPRPLLSTAQADDFAKAQLDAGVGLRTLIHMDDPHHRKVRAIGADWFRPKAMRDLKVQVDRLAKRYVDRLREIGPECDFVAEIAVNFPLYVIMSLLGLPEDDFPRMHMLTQEMFGGDDEEYNKRGKSPEEQLTILLDFFTYVSELTASRREHPTEDLASAIANGRVDGEPLSDVDTASYYVIVASAGHDTTKDAISGGLLALIENPSELERLRQNMDLMPTAVEEIVRWASPVIFMRRTLAVDTVLGGQAMQVGDKVAMFYWAANRDPAHFADPDAFDVRRTPNHHVGFGGPGPHFCLGAHLARREMTVMFRELLTRAPEVHATAAPRRLQSMFINGIKELPVALR